MPAKVNPVIPEVVNQVAFQVIGNDTTVTLAAEAGQLELNAFEPIMFRDILASETYLANAIQTLVANCVSGITVNEERCQENVEHSAVVATALSPYLGYEKTTLLVKRAVKENRSIRELLKTEHLLAPKLVDHLLSPANLTNQKVSHALAQES